MAQKQMNWYGLTGLVSPFPMTANDFAQRLRSQRGRVTYDTVRIVGDAKITARTNNAAVEFTGRRG